jgi:hypothetical protein
MAIFFTNNDPKTDNLDEQIVAIFLNLSLTVII